VPYADVQTSVYVFEAGVPHNFKTDIVKFIDLRQDGYKRTKRRLYEIDNPEERYVDIPIIFRMGLNADKHPEFHKELWNLSESYVENTITDSGADWNFEQHKRNDTKPTKVDFIKTVGDYLAWEANLLIEKGYGQMEMVAVSDKEAKKMMLSACNDELSEKDVSWREFRAGCLFEIIGNPQLNKESFNFSKYAQYPYFTRTMSNNGISGYVDYLDDEHRIKGNSLAIGMMGMTFFYMKEDFYAGQFTKTAFPKFDGFNRLQAMYFCTILNKFSPIYQSELVREFERLFNETLIKLPINSDGSLNFEYIENYIKKMELEYIADLEEKRNLEISATKLAAREWTT